MDHRPEFLHRVLGINDVPDFNVIGLLPRQLLDQLAALLRRLDFHNRRIAVQFELRARDARDERPGHRDARRFLD
jgi:hypothetical protein